jgi:hypothetical protein
VGKGRKPNYLHQLASETIDLLESGGLWKYSGDSHETLQALCKQLWMDFSARGGQGRGRLHPCEVVYQRHTMKIHLCTVPEGPRKLVIVKRDMAELKAIAAALQGS